MNKLYTLKSRIHAASGPSGLPLSGATGVLFAFLVLFLTGITQRASAQAGCDANVPSFYIDLTGTPDSVWNSPQLTRAGNCCGTVSPDRCLRIEFTIDSNVAAVGFQITSGAIPPGALFFQVDCGPISQVGSLSCISTPGFHALTFCKPGNNVNTYQLISIPKPTFPARDTVRVGCSKTLEVLGLTDPSLTWNSIFPGAPGQYNSLLSCTAGCNDPIFTPTASTPVLVKYLVCGHPIADLCGFVDVCDTVEVAVYPTLGVTVTPNPASYCPSSPGVLLTASPGGGLGPYTYVWKNGSGVQVGTGSTYFATSPQTYTVEVSDELVPECPKTIISVPVTVSTINLTTSKRNVSCFGGNNGMAIVSGTGGAQPYSFSWSPGGQTNDTAFNLTAQSYTVTVTDAGGCTNTATVSITQPSDLVINTDSVVNVKCNGELTGAIYINITGGTSPYSYLWDNGEITQDITLLAAGSYEVVVTDSMGCKDSLTFNVTQPGAIVPLPGGPLFGGTSPSCYGVCDGTLSITVTGGTLPYSYAWTPSGTTQTINTLCAGAYCVTVADANGCTVAACTTLTQPDSLFGFIQGVSSYFGGFNISCAGASDGSIDLEVSGGTLPYGYSWSPGGASSQDLTNVQADTFTVTITDDNGCVANNTVILTQPDTLLVSLFSPLTPNGTNIGCKGESSGQIFATVTGGTTAYAYSWNYGGATSLNLLNVPAGFYVDTVTDANGCIALDTITLTEPDTLFALITSATVIGGANISCNGDSTGTASVILTGGTPPFNYQWFPSGDSTAAIDSVPAGTIWVVVHDFNFCSASDTATLVQPDSLSTFTLAASFAGGYNVSCFGSTNGSAWVTPSGGSAPYTYLWSPSGSVNDTAFNLGAGWHYVVVTDANLCTMSDSILLTEPDSLQSPPLPSLFPSGTNVACKNDSSGSIDVTVLGGTPPFTYAWNSGQTTQDITNLPAGFYSVVITDTNGCVASANTTLTEPLSTLVIDSLVSPAYPGGWNISCNGGTNGSILSYPSGGSPPYTYLWSNGDSTLNTFNVSVTTYYDTVWDVNGCMALDSITLTEPPLLVASATAAININCFGDSSGTISISVTGGTPPYRFASDTNLVFQSDSTFSNMPAGTYFITIADTNGCSDTLTVILSEPPSAFVAGESHVNILCFGDSTGSITITATGGVTPYSYSFNSGPADTISAFTNLPSGPYTILAEDANGCSVPFNITITQPAAPLAAIIENAFNINCHGDSTGSLEVSITGGTTPYQMTLDTASMPWQSDTLFANLPAGSYTVFVRDTNGCTTSIPIILTEPPLLVIDSIVSTPTSCGVDNGTASVFVSGGQPGYSYSWSLPSTSTSDTALGLPVGTYSVLITDAKGCTLIDSIFVNNLANLSLAVSATVANNCFGDSLGSITATPTGGTAPFSYSWTLPANDTTATADSLASGSYTVTVTDSSGCTATASATLIDPPLLDANITSSFDISCFGGNNGSATVGATGGTGTYTYQWSSAPNDTNATVTGLSANISYSIVVTDSLGCSAVDSVTLSEPATAVSVSVTGSIDVSCFGGSNGIAIAVGGGGTGTITYSWNTPVPQLNDTATGLPAGTYTVVATDSLGCSDSASVVITEPTQTVDIAVSAFSNVSCYGDSTGYAVVLPAGGTPPYTYLWSTTPPPGQMNDTAFNLSAGTYTVIVTDTLGCSDTASVTITQPAAGLQASISKADLTCFGSNDGTATASGSGGTIPYTYQWSTGDTIAALTALDTGTYTVVITDSAGCMDTASTSLIQPAAISTNAGADSTICEPPAYTLNADPAPGGFTGLWSAVGSNPTFGSPNNEQSTVSNLVAGLNILVWTIDDGTCTASDTVIIEREMGGKCLELELPSGFTPNGDTHNDDYDIHGIENYPLNQFKVFNRWGNEVYSKLNYVNHDWKGRNNNDEDLPDGTYFVILVISEHNIVRTTYVDLRR